MALIRHQAWALENPIFFTPPPVRGRYVHGLWGGGGGDAPAPPDPYKTADAQLQANNAAAVKQAALNRTNSVTPFGSSTWTQDPNNPDSYTNTVKLSDQTQGMVDQFYNMNSTPLAAVDNSKLPAVSSSDLSGVKSSASGLAAGQAGIMSQLQQQAADTYSKPLSYDSLGAMPKADEAMRQKVADALYANSTSRLDPQWQQQQNDQMSSLAAQGINLGSEAYDRAYGDFSRAKTDAYSQARNDSTTMSTDQMSKLFQMAMSARQEGVSEINNKYTMPMQLMSSGQGVYSGLQATADQDKATQANLISTQHNMSSADRTNALNENLATHNSAQQDRNAILNQLTALASGSQMAPGSPVQVQAAPVAQSIYNTYQGQLSAYNAGQQSNNSMLGTLGSLGGAAMMAFAA